MKTPPQQATGYQKEDDPEPARSKLRGIAPKEIENGPVPIRQQHLTRTDPLETLTDLKMTYNPGLQGVIWHGVSPLTLQRHFSKMSPKTLPIGLFLSLTIVQISRIKAP